MATATHTQFGSRTPERQAVAAAVAVAMWASSPRRLAPPSVAPCRQPVGPVALRLAQVPSASPGPLGPCLTSSSRS